MIKCCTCWLIKSDNYDSETLTDKDRLITWTISQFALFIFCIDFNRNTAQRQATCLYS